MFIIGIASVVTAITLVVLTVFAIPVLIEVRKAAHSLRTMSESLDGELRPLIRELRQTVADVQDVTKVISANADGVGDLLEEIGNAAHNVRNINRVAAGVTGLVSGTSVWLTGARVAGKFIAEKLSKKRG